MAVLLRRPNIVPADTEARDAPSSVRALQYVEIDVDFCSLRYGTTNGAGTCPAILGTSSAIKCFNTLKTCAVPASFTNVPVTLRFAVPTDYLPNDIDANPSIKSISYDASTISLGDNLGQRASLTIAFQDHRDSDAGTGNDPYLSERDYNPYETGTFFGKFRARQPYLVGRSLRWINGVLGQALADMETRHFLIDSFSGPNSNGEYKIIAKDVLKLADDDKSQAPFVSDGFLVTDITAIDTTATLSPSGIGNSEYAASGYVAIGGSEICAFTRSGDVLTLTRASQGTTASAHKAQDRVQQVLIYSAATPATIIADLLENYAGIPSSYIPASDWSTEVSTYLNRVYSAVIPQPTGVKTLISELIQQAGLSIWWNDRDQRIELLVLRGIVSSAEQLTESNLQNGTLDLSEQPDKRLSEVHTYFGQINALTSLTDKSNYRSVSVVSDSSAEANYGAAAIKEIFSRWIPALGRTVADRLGAILIGRFRDPPRHFKASVLRYSTQELLLGYGYQVSAWPIQDARGEATTMPVQITRLKPMADLIDIEADEVLFNAPAEDLASRHITVDANVFNVNMRDAHDSLYPAPSNGITVTLTVLSGVIVGSTSTALPALDIGTWPTGVTLNLVVQGRIEGAGGRGGDNLGNTPQPGAPGGPALYARTAIHLDDSAGEIWGGGGGGGGGNGFVNEGGGGGGGAGYKPGLGAQGEDGTNVAAQGVPGTTEAGGLGGTFAAGVGGTGGGPGLPGGGGGPTSVVPGGAAGNAIDGISYVTTTAGPLDRRGAQVN